MTTHSAKCSLRSFEKFPSYDLTSEQETEMDIYDIETKQSAVASFEFKVDGSPGPYKLER
jgi:hypothetical protein